MIEFIKNFEKFKIAYDDLERNISFHDAEIISILLERKNPNFPEVIVKLFHYVENLGGFIENGKKYSKWKTAEFVLTFKDARFVELEGFNHQNVINGLDISQNEGFYKAWFNSNFGCDLKLECEEIELTEIQVFETVVERYEPSEEKLQKMREIMREKKLHKPN